MTLWSDWQLKYSISFLWEIGGICSCSSEQQQNTWKWIFENWIWTKCILSYDSRSLTIADQEAHYSGVQVKYYSHLPTLYPYDVTTATNAERSIWSLANNSWLKIRFENWSVFDWTKPKTDQRQTDLFIGFVEDANPCKCHRISSLCVQH